MSSDGDASLEVDVAAVVSWPQWKRLPGGGSGGHGDEDLFFAVLCGASDDFFVWWLGEQEKPCCNTEFLHTCVISPH